tara:strand:+ start:404 stop:880 length:477 start_codon:yes stop_codon:yes gene_type:complete
MSIFATSPFATTSFSTFEDSGGVTLEAVVNMIGTSSKTSVGVKFLIGSASISSNFTKTSTQTLIHGASAEKSSNFTQASDGIKVLLISSDASMQFDKTTQGNATFNSSETISSNLQTSVLGEILWEDDISPAETFTIVSGGDETWTIVGTGDEVWTEQ